MENKSDIKNKYIKKTEREVFSTNKMNNTTKETEKKDTCPIISMKGLGE